MLQCCYRNIFLYDVVYDFLIFFILSVHLVFMEYLDNFLCVDVSSVISVDWCASIVNELIDTFVNKNHRVVIVDQQLFKF